MFERFLFNIGGTVREETLEGRKYLVVPTAMMAEGVWTGNNGAYFYPAAEFAKSVPTWNHKPLVVYHPIRDGKGVSACDPVVLNTRKVGIILNTAYNDKLRTESWLDIEKCNEVDARIIEAVRNNKQVEVSTGLYVDALNQAGEYDGKKYSQVAVNYRPDHLAILPDTVGAYSIRDGGGMLQINQSRDAERTLNILTRSFQKGLDRYLQSVGAKFTANELSFSDVSRALSDLLAAKLGKPGQYWDGYICEVFSNFVVYYDGDYDLYAVGYTQSNNTVALDGDPVAVKRVVNYQTADGKSLVANQSGVLVPQEEKTMFDKKAHVTSLIGNGFEEKDRGHLEGLPDDVLAKILPKSAPAQTQNQDNKNGTGTATQTPPPAATTQPAQPAPQLGWNDIVANADPAVKEMIGEWQSSFNAEKTKLIETITANATAAQVYKPEALLAKPIAELRNIAALVQATQPPVHNGVPNFMGAAAPAPMGGMNQNQKAPEPLVAPTMEFASPLKK